MEVHNSSNYLLTKRQTLTLLNRMDLLLFTAGIYRTHFLKKKSGFKNHDEIISLLIKHGANPDAESKFGRTALHEAAFDGNSKALEALLKGGATADAKGNISRICGPYER